MKPDQKKPAPDTIHINFRQVIYALSDALDFVGIDEIQHGKRVGYMLYECAGVLGWDETEKTSIFEMGLLHDCGVSSTNVHRHLVEYFDWESSTR